jgi:anti-sigma B factor antagonist
LKGEFLILCKPKLSMLVVDLKDVEFCDSSGLSALLIADRKMREHGGRVRLLNVHKKVSSLIKISMLDRVFDLSDE